jgi:hypothetical protein
MRLLFTRKSMVLPISSRFQKLQPQSAGIVSGLPTTIRPETSFRHLTSPFVARTLLPLMICNEDLTII